MADAPAAVAAPEPAATPEPAPAPEPAAAEVDLIEAAAERLAEGTEATETAEPEAKDEPKEGEPAAAKTSEQLAAEDEALFTDKALSTAAGVKAAAERLRVARGEITAERSKLAGTQRKIDYDFRVLKNREAKFKTTKSEHLAWHTEQRGQAQMLGQHVNILRTGSPTQVVESLGFLTGKDGLAIYEEIVKNAAGLRQAPNPEIEQLRAEMRAEREAFRRANEEQQLTAKERELKAGIADAEQKVIAKASDASAYPTLSQYAGIRPREVLAEIVSMRKNYKAETGTALPLADAMVELDQQLALMLRKQEGRGAGNPQLEESQNPGGKPSQSSPAKRTGSVAGIPPSASTRVAATRPATEEERRQELTPEFYAELGLM